MTARTSAVVVETMVISALVGASRRGSAATAYRLLVADRPVVVSFVTVTELRYGAP